MVKNCMIADSRLSLELEDVVYLVCGCVDRCVLRDAFPFELVF